MQPAMPKSHEKQTPGRPKCFSSPLGGRTPQGGGLGGAVQPPEASDPKPEHAQRGIQSIAVGADGHGLAQCEGPHPAAHTGGSVKLGRPAAAMQN